MSLDEEDLARVRALESYHILDTPPDELFDSLTRLAAQVLGVPISLVSLVDADRQWFKSRVGLEATQTPREVAFCDHAIREQAPFVVPDALQDPRFATNPLVTDSPNVRFYAGIPLYSPDGHGLGTLCIIDRQPREIDDDQLEILQLLAVQAAAGLEIHRKSTLLQARLEGLVARQERHEMLVSMVVHDLRSPLTVVIAEASAELSLHPDLADGLEEILAAGHRMQRMLLDILDICISGLGSLTIRPTTADLHALAADQVKAFARIAEREGHSIRLRQGPGGLVARVDPELMGRMIANLLENALRFSPSGGVVDIGVHAGDGEGVIVVSDTGPGVSEADASRIFEPLERGVGQPSPTGYGLGLAFCKLAAEAHGGTIRLEPNPPGGSRFVVRIPTR